MVKSALQRQRIPSADEGVPQEYASEKSPDASFRSKEAHPGVSTRANDPFNIGSFDLVRKFVEHVVAKNRSVVPGNGCSSGNVDWDAVEMFVADSHSFEQAIGRAVVIADQMCRGVFDDIDSGNPSPLLPTEGAFFAFSLADAAPDFGDESRYRTKMARRVARIFGIRRTPVTLAISLLLVVLSVPLHQGTQHGSTANAALVPLPIAPALPAGAPSSLVGVPLRSHEVFWFAPHNQSAAST